MADTQRKISLSDHRIFVDKDNDMACRMASVHAHHTGRHGLTCSPTDSTDMAECTAYVPECNPHLNVKLSQRIRPESELFLNKLRRKRTTMAVKYGLNASTDSKFPHRDEYVQQHRNHEHRGIRQVNVKDRNAKHMTMKDHKSQWDFVNDMVKMNIDIRDAKRMNEVINHSIEKLKLADSNDTEVGIGGPVVVTPIEIDDKVTQPLDDRCPSEVKCPSAATLSVASIEIPCVRDEYSEHSRYTEHHANAINHDRPILQTQRTHTAFPTTNTVVYKSDPAGSTKPHWRKTVQVIRDTIRNEGMRTSAFTTNHAVVCTSDSASITEHGIPTPVVNNITINLLNVEDMKFDDRGYAAERTQTISSKHSPSRKKRSKPKKHYVDTYRSSLSGKTSLETRKELMEQAYIKKKVLSGRANSIATYSPRNCQSSNEPVINTEQEEVRSTHSGDSVKGVESSTSSTCRMEEYKLHADRKSCPAILPEGLAKHFKKKSLADVQQHEKGPKTPDIISDRHTGLDKHEEELHLKTNHHKKEDIDAHITEHQKRNCDKHRTLSERKLTGNTEKSTRDYNVLIDVNPEQESREKLRVSNPKILMNPYTGEVQPKTSIASLDLLSRKLFEIISDTDNSKTSHPHGHQRPKSTLKKHGMITADDTADDSHGNDGYGQFYIGHVVPEIDLTPATSLPRFSHLPTVSFSQFLPHFPHVDEQNIAR